MELNRERKRNQNIYKVKLAAFWQRYQQWGNKREFSHSHGYPHTHPSRIGIHTPDIILSLCKYNRSESWSVYVSSGDHVSNCSLKQTFPPLRSGDSDCKQSQSVTQFWMWVVTGELCLVVSRSENFPRQDSCEQNRRCPQKNMSNETWSVCCSTEVSTDQGEEDDLCK